MLNVHVRGNEENALTENEKDFFSKEEIKLKLRTDSKNKFSRILCVFLFSIVGQNPKSKINVNMHHLALN